MVHRGGLLLLFLPAFLAHRGLRPTLSPLLVSPPRSPLQVLPDPFFRRLAAVGTNSTETGCDSETASNFWGGMLSCIASVISNFGVNIQKFAHMINDRKPLHLRKDFMKMGVWWLGLLCVILGAVGDFIALGIAAQSLVTALGGATTLVANVLIARFWLREKLQVFDLIGVAFIIAGAVIIGLKTPCASAYTLDQLVDNFFSDRFRLYLIVLSIILFVGIATVADTKFYKWRKSLTMGLLRPLTRRIEIMRAREYELLQRVEKLEARYAVLEMLVVEDGTTPRRRLASDTPRTKQLRLREYGESRRVKTLARWGDPQNLENGHGHGDAQLDGDEARDGTGSKMYLSWVDAFTFAACAGGAGALSVVLAGCASKVLIISIKGDNLFARSIAPYIFIFGMVACVAVQTGYLNKALMLGDVMTVYPVFQAFWILLGVVGGMMFYQEYSQRLSMNEWYWHWAALAGMLLGCMFLMRHGKEMWNKNQGKRGVKGERDAAQKLVAGRWRHEDMEELDDLGSPSKRRRASSNASLLEDGQLPAATLGAPGHVERTPERQRRKHGSGSMMDIEEEDRAEHESGAAGPGASESTAENVGNSDGDAGSDALPVPALTRSASTQNKHLMAAAAAATADGADDAKDDCSQARGALPPLSSRLSSAGAVPHDCALVSVADVPPHQEPPKKHKRRKSIDTQATSVQMAGGSVQLVSRGPAQLSPTKAQREAAEAASKPVWQREYSREVEDRKQARKAAVYAARGEALRRQHREALLKQKGDQAAKKTKWKLNGKVHIAPEPTPGEALGAAEGALADV